MKKDDIYGKLCNGIGISHNGMRFPLALEFERSPFRTARHPVGPQVHGATGEPLYVLPGGGRATERQIRGMV